MTFETKLTISSAVSRMVTTMNMQRLAQANTESYDTFGDDKNTTESEAVQSD